MHRSVHEHPYEPVVEIEGLMLEGWIAQASCTACHGQLVHYIVFDALCCPSCNTWAAVLCDDPGCLFCRVRPERPLAA